MNLQRIKKIHSNGYVIKYKGVLKIRKTLKAAQQALADIKPGKIKATKNAGFDISHIIKI